MSQRNARSTGSLVVAKTAKSRVKLIRFRKRLSTQPVWGRGGIGTQADSLPASCYSQVIRPSKLGKPVACPSLSLPFHLNTPQAPLGAQHSSPASCDT